MDFAKVKAKSDILQPRHIVTETVLPDLYFRAEQTIKRPPDLASLVTIKFGKTN
jgi:hypothetical protein